MKYSNGFIWITFMSSISQYLYHTKWKEEKGEGERICKFDDLVNSRRTVRFAQFNAQTCPIVPQLIYSQSSLLSRRSRFISPFTIYWAQSKTCWRPYIIPLLELNQLPLPSWVFCFPHSYWFRLWRYLLGFFCTQGVFSFSSCKLFSPVKTMWEVEIYWQVSFHGLLIPVLQRCSIWFSN